MKFRIYYEDTDAAGIAYHANYLKYCERARSELFFQNNMSPATDGGHFVIKSLQAEYKKPAKLGDMLEAKHQMIELKHTSLTLKQSVWLGDIELFEMVSVLVFVKDNRPAKMSKKVKEFFKSFF